MRLRELRPFKQRQSRTLFRRTHVCPNDPSALYGRIGFETDLRLERGIGRQVEHVEAVTRDVEFPTVINTTETVFLIAPEKKGCATMRAELVDESQPAGGVFNHDKAPTEKFYANRRA